MTRIFLIKKAKTAKYTIELTNLTLLSYDLNTPVSPLPLPEESHEENVLIKMEGNSAQISMSFKIPPNSLIWGTSTGVIGSHSFTPTANLTPLEIINNIKSSFVPKSITDGYILEIQGSGNDSLSEQGTIANISFSVSGESPVTWDCNITFFVGNVIGLYEANVPYNPNTAIMSKTSGTSITVAWSKSAAYASAADSPIITGASIKYKKDSSAAWVEWTDPAVSNDTYAYGNGGEDPSNQPASVEFPTNKLLTGLSAGTYKIKVAQLCSTSDESNVFYYTQAKTTSGSYEITLP